MYSILYEYIVYFGIIALCIALHSAFTLPLRAAAASMNRISCIKIKISLIWNFP